MCDQNAPPRCDPLVRMLIAVRRGAPPDPAKAGVLIGGAALVMAALLMRSGPAG